MIAAYAATLFGLGRVRFAPGTAASLATLPVAWIAMMVAGQFGVLALGLATAAAGFWASDVYARQARARDPSECVIDEAAGQFLTCAAAPPTLVGFALAFALFRLFDISKLWPVSAAERLRGGLGIMADDLVAGLIAGLIVAVLDNVGLI